MSKGEEIIRFENVVKTFGQGESLQKAADNVSFSIAEGEFVVILGPSGAGKSTVLNMLGGMDVPTSGRILVGGREIQGLGDRQMSTYRAEMIGFIFQFYNLIPSMTAYENVALTRNIVKNAADPMEMLDKVGLKDHAKKFPTQMSGGEQQRISIARALAKRPKILVGDEPTGALDSETGKKVLGLLTEMSRKEGQTVIIVTHNADIAKCADRVIRMKNARIREILTNEHPLSVEEVEW